MDEIQKDIMADYINNMIKQAIYYGGDLGGAYFTEKEGKKLFEQMKEFAAWIIPEYSVGMIRGVPIFVKIVG